MEPNKNGQGSQQWNSQFHPETVPQHYPPTSEPPESKGSANVSREGHWKLWHKTVQRITSQRIPSKQWQGNILYQHNIKRSSASWNSPHSSGVGYEHKVCVDYRKLNRLCLCGDMPDYHEISIWEHYGKVTCVESQAILGTIIIECVAWCCNMETE